MRLLFLTLLLNVVLPVFAQQGKDERAAIRDLVTKYKQFYDNARIAPDSVDLSDLSKLFSSQAVPIFNDFYDDGTAVFPNPTAYFDDFDAFMLRNDTLVTREDWQISDEGNTYYAKYEQVYFAWVRKRFKYRFDSCEKDIDNWCRLTIRWINDQDGYRIVGVERSQEPDDDDHDGIPNAFDDDQNSKHGARIGISGREQKEDMNELKKVQHQKQVQEQLAELSDKFQALSEENRLLLEQHYADSIRWIRKRGRNPKIHVPPASRLSLELTGAGVYPLSTSFNRQDLLSYEGNSWKDSGALANKYGYGGGLSLHYNISRRVTLGAGYQLFFLPFATQQLQSQIGTFLTSHGKPGNLVDVSANAWHLHLIYLSAGVGKLEYGKSYFRLESLVGVVRTDMVWDDHLRVAVSEPNGKSMANSMLLLKYDPFPVWGGKFTYQWGFGRHGNVRLQLSMEYVQGQSPNKSQRIQFGEVNGDFVLPAPNIKMLNGNVGFHFTLHRP